MGNKIILLFLGWCSITGLAKASPDSTASDTLSLFDAVSLAMEQNHHIQIARNEARIDANNATPGNAGYLPSINVTGTFQKSVINTKLYYRNSIPDQDQVGSQSSLYKSSINFSYTLFDGFGNKYRLHRLRSVEKYSDAQSRLEIEQTLIEVVRQYLQIIARNQLLKIDKETMEVSYERFNKAQQRYEMSGRTQDVGDRFIRHQQGRNKSTKAGVPWLLVFVKPFESRSEAVRWESGLKAQKDRSAIEEEIRRGWRRV